MSDLKSFVALQARLYQFLEQQDETTLQALASGAAQLAVLGAEVPLRRAPAAPTMTPSRDPLQVAQDLSAPLSEQERRSYLRTAGLSVKDLRAVARSLRLRHYSTLTRDRLIDLLATQGPDRTETLVSEPTSPPPDADESRARPLPSSQEASRSAERLKSGVDVAGIASHLRELETEEEGAEYLHAQRLDRAGLLAVATELQLTRVSRLNPTELEKRVLKQAIGARRKFAGLRKW